MKTNIALKGWESLNIKRSPGKKSESSIELVTTKRNKWHKSPHTL
jgi:hypothetical protein